MKRFTLEDPFRDRKEKYYKIRNTPILNRPLEQAYPQEHRVPEKPKFSVMTEEGDITSKTAKKILTTEALNIRAPSM